ncbi:probable ATP-dependent RNA helicase DDX49 [Nephila pilipes]|uniref:RNA helicase n=1 Tax=Nephila pilipes TaxID=299642 RepID=A0A8X6QIB1_NEPPI|nr:probable ATP-dependent RNA helicase DDX49 [Nephila pilipes]
MSSIPRDEGFEELMLKKWLVKQCTEMGITKPTDVQRHCIPQILAGKNCLAVSKTGTGKTLAFALPLLHVLSTDPYGIFALILTPTRELAVQIYEQIKVIGKPMHVNVCLIIGGMNQVKQGGEIDKRPHIVVATPGRLADMMQNSYDIFFKNIQFLIVDEADRILSGSFTEQLEVILKALPRKRQCLFFSATMTEMLETCIKSAENPPFVWKAEAEVPTVTELKQQYILIRNAVVRSANLVQLINEYQTKTPDSSMIIFTKNCDVCQIVSQALEKLGFVNVALNSHLRQHERTANITKFKSNRVRILIATDIASRGLDIPMVDLVVNYNVPPVPTNYVHRVGRTARAGRGGLALTLMTPKEVKRLLNIEKEINYKLTEYKISEKKVLEIALQVEVAFREAAINLDYDEHKERKEMNKRKRIFLSGGEIYVQSKREQKKNNKKYRNSAKVDPEMMSKETAEALGIDVESVKKQVDSTKKENDSQSNKSPGEIDKRFQRRTMKNKKYSMETKTEVMSKEIHENLKEQKLDENDVSPKRKENTNEEFRNLKKTKTDL